MKTSVAKAGNKLYEFAPALYRPLYSAYKALSDRRERRLFAEWIRSGDCVLDVGANIGIYTRFFADLVGQQGRVIAVEPDEKNLALLERIRSNRRQVEIVRAVAGAQSGVAELFVSPDLNVDHRSYDAGDHRVRKRVASRTIDELTEGRSVNAVKMDIQGAEVLALRGASRLLGSAHPLLMILEYWPFGIRQAGGDPRELIDMLKHAGMTVNVVGGDPLPGPDEQDPELYVNIVAARGGSLRS